MTKVSEEPEKKSVHSEDNVFDEGDPLSSKGRDYTSNMIFHDPLDRLKPSLTHKGRSSTVDLGDIQAMKLKDPARPYKPVISRVILSWPKRHTYHKYINSRVMSPEKFRRLCAEQKMREHLSHDRIPRDPKMERKCQCFAIIVAILGLIAVFLVAITFPTIPGSLPFKPDAYKSMCQVSDMIPVYGSINCSTFRSRFSARVSCTVQCRFGIDESMRSVVVAAEDSDDSFTISCVDGPNNTYTWGVFDEVKVNTVCLEDPSKQNT